MDIIYYTICAHSHGKVRGRASEPARKIVLTLEFEERIGLPDTRIEMAAGASRFARTQGCDSRFDAGHLLKGVEKVPTFAARPDPYAGKNT